MTPLSTAPTVDKDNDDADADDVDVVDVVSTVGRTVGSASIKSCGRVTAADILSGDRVTAADTNVNEGEEDGKQADDDEEDGKQADDGEEEKEEGETKVYDSIVGCVDDDDVEIKRFPNHDFTAWTAQVR